MKRWIAKLLAFVLVFSTVAVSNAVWQPTQSVSAASIALSATSKRIVIGNTYTITLRNAASVTKTGWKSSNTKVATVSSKGVVTAVAEGTATITCSLTLSSGKTQSLTCKITVRKRIPATAVSMNYIHDEINAHVITVGDKYDFNTKLTPSNSTDTTYYFIADPDIATVSSAGILTAKKPGITTLVARIGLNYKEAKKSTNKVVARTYILVQPSVPVTPTPTPTPTPTLEPKVTDVTLVSSKEIQISFNTEILKSSIINSNGDLIDGVIAVTEGKAAKDVGLLSAKVADNLKSVNLTATGEFEGTYVVSVFNKILTADNQIIPTAAFQKDFKDLIGPMYLNTEVDDTGYICKINFNEAIDISEMSITSVNGTNDSGIKSYLTSPSSYTLSEDKKTLQINLASLPYKEFAATVNMLNIKDMKGNRSSSVQISALVRCDATEKPLANIIDVERVSKNQLVATFDRPIQYPGIAIINFDYCNGVVNPENNKQVIYTLTNSAITGVKSVEFNGFYNYNAVYTSNSKVTRNVNFTLDTTPPKVISNEFTMEAEAGSTIYRLTITYDKKISVVNGVGSLSTRINSTDGNIVTKYIEYTALANEKVLTLTFANQTFAPGYYNFKLPDGLVMDVLGNLSTANTVNVYKQAGSSAALPAPISVNQDATNPSKVIVTFANKLDMSSAQNPQNYSLDGNTSPINVSIKEQTEDNAIVELTFAQGAIENTTTHAISINSIKGYNDSYGTMKSFYTTLTMVENCSPTFVTSKLSNNYSVLLTFNEEVTGTGTFQMIGQSGLVNITSIYTSGNTIYLSLPEVVTADGVVIVVNTNNFTDSNNNPAQLPSQILATD